MALAKLRGSSRPRFSFRAELRACESLLLLFLIASSPLFGLDPTKQIDQYAHAEWKSQHGLPGDAVYQITQTRDGYLWIGTSAGLVRFDGVRFVAFDALIGNGPVKAITLNADGDLLIRTNVRTLIYRHGVFSDYLPPAALPDGGIRTLFEGRNHDVLLGSDDFIYLLQNQGPRMLVRGTGHVDAFAQENAGKVWIGGAWALYSYQNGSLTKSVDLSSNRHHSISALATDHLQDLLVGTWDGLYRKHPDKALLQPIAPKEIRGHIQAIMEDRQGNLWVGGDGTGLVRMKGDKISRFNASDGLTDNNVLALFEDREGSVWVGTASGVDHLRDTKVTTLTTKEGLPSNDARAVFETRNGNMFVFCVPGGVGTGEGRPRHRTHEGRATLLPGKRRI